LIDNADVSYLDPIFLDEDGLLSPFPASALKHVPQDHISIWCVKHAVYQLPTIELIAWLKDRIGDSHAIEICAGKSGIGHLLGITATDSYCQVEIPEIKMYYELLRQPTIQPPDYVVKMDANKAVKYYDPQIIIGAWVTQRWLSDADKDGNAFGPLEEEFLVPGKQYIHIGNEATHGTKRILKYPHQKFCFPWLKSRAFEPEKNAIWIWGEK